MSSSSSLTSAVTGRCFALADGESGLSARTIAGQLSSVSGLYAYLIARGDTSLGTNPVPEVCRLDAKADLDALLNRAARASAAHTSKSALTCRSGPIDKRTAHEP